MPRRLIIGILAAAIVLGSCQLSAAPRDPLAMQIEASLSSRPLLAVGEVHRDAESHALLHRLIADRSFICRFDDIVVEFGNGRLQTLADRYISGETVAISEARAMWRDTGQWVTWDSPLYQQFFETIRSLNAEHTCPHPIRVLLADPPIDWSLVRSADDYRPFMDRDGYYADVVEREVLAKGHRGLLIAGVGHMMKRQAEEISGRAHSAGLAEIIERRHPGSIFSLLPLQRPETASSVGLTAPGTFVAVADTPLEARSYASVAPTGISAQVRTPNGLEWRPLNELTWPAMTDVVDGFVFIAEGQSVDPDPAIYLDAIYQAELRRRAAILRDVWGVDFLPDLEELVARAHAQQTPPPAP